MDAILKDVLHVHRLLGAQDDNINLIDIRTGVRIKTLRRF